MPIVLPIVLPIVPVRVCASEKVEASGFVLPRKLKLPVLPTICCLACHAVWHDPEINNGDIDHACAKLFNTPIGNSISNLIGK